MQVFGSAFKFWFRHSHKHTHTWCTSGRHWHLIQWSPSWELVLFTTRPSSALRGEEHDGLVVSPFSVVLALDKEIEKAGPYFWSFYLYSCLGQPLTVSCGRLRFDSCCRWVPVYVGLVSLNSFTNHGYGLRYQPLSAPGQSGSQCCKFNKCLYVTWYNHFLIQRSSITW